MEPTWSKISDDRVRHIWGPKDTISDEGNISVDPSWYAENGTPMDPETGDDMVYLYTEIQI